ncbi:MAG: hypothetical protein K0S68_846 [Candidatus Saccharibacteria bacterium]|nr:hypothetical protein [Candidatus Saccharibacteria bacterium]
MYDKVRTHPVMGPFVNLLGQFRDVRAIGLVLFLAVALMVTWSGAKVIQTNYELQQQISRLEQEIAVQELANRNLKLQNQYFQTDQYLELQARQDFGLGAPGETQLIVPKEVAEKYVANDTAGDSSSKIPAKIEQPAYQRNFEAWIGFFLHRPFEVES